VSKRVTNGTRALYFSGAGKGGALQVY